MHFPLSRNRRLRSNEAIRSLVAETHLSPNDFLLPVFATKGRQVKKEIASMPDYFKYSPDTLIEHLKEVQQMGIKGILLFCEIDEALKDNTGKEAVNPHGFLPDTIKRIKDALPELLLFSDIALDPFSSYGHDGIVEGNKIVNDKTVDVLAQMAVVHANAGADFVAPSDMMDGRIKAIRMALDNQGYTDTGILAYSAKYASAYYGPFRDALDSAPGFGDKKNYQMNPANSVEALNEVQKDIDEGADIVMVKPALNYLDVIYRVKQNSTVPVSAYHVSGEYAMIKAAAKNGWIDEQAAIWEATTAIKRAGTDLIASYFAIDICKNL